jgi:hypothetical protein
MMHLEALPNVHYIPVGSQYLELNEYMLKGVATNLGLLIQERYTFNCFKYSFMEILRLTIKEERR